MKLHKNLFLNYYSFYKFVIFKIYKFISKKDKAQIFLPFLESNIVGIISKIFKNFTMEYLQRTSMTYHWHKFLANFYLKKSSFS